MDNSTSFERLFTHDKEGPRGGMGPQDERRIVGMKEPDDMRIVGQKGQMGDTGLQGETKITGEKGPPGNKGPRGDQGPRGDIGPQGKKGPDGDKGPAGNKGVGNKGPKGCKGHVGDPGLDGEPGPEGKRGPVGDSGVSSTDTKHILYIVGGFWGLYSVLLTVIGLQHTNTYLPVYVWKRYFIISFVMIVASLIATKVACCLYRLGDDWRRVTTCVSCITYTIAFVACLLLVVVFFLRL